MNDEPLAPPTLPELERALDEAVSTLVAFRAKPPEAAERALAPKRDAPLPVIPIQQLIGTDSSVLRDRELASSPVEFGMKKAIKELGKLIHGLVGNDGMLEVAERVAGLDDKNWGRRMSPINAAWDGIGTWYA